MPSYGEKKSLCPICGSEVVGGFYVTSSGTATMFYDCESCFLMLPMNTVDEFWDSDAKTRKKLRDDWIGQFVEKSREFYLEACEGLGITGE